MLRHVELRLVSKRMGACMCVYWVLGYSLGSWVLTEARPAAWIGLNIGDSGEDDLAATEIGMATASTFLRSLSSQGQEGNGLEGTYRCSTSEESRRSSPESEATPISLYVAALARILEGFRRGGRGDDDGVTARPDLVHGGRRDDGDAAVALGARSRASECAVAFLFNRCMEWDKIRWNGDGIKSRLRNAKEEETTAAPWRWRPSSSRWPAMEMRATEPSASSALDTSRPRVEHAQSSVGSDSLRSLSVSVFLSLREVNKCKDKPVRLS
uniref:Uncharacterized protein n=1 Tax=Oryza barthii TaxID=65489 RepID=A0A0D3F5F2_9ORYZ